MQEKSAPKKSKKLLKFSLLYSLCFSVSYIVFLVLSFVFDYRIAGLIGAVLSSVISFLPIRRGFIGTGSGKKFLLVFSFILIVIFYLSLLTLFVFRGVNIHFSGFFLNLFFILGVISVPRIFLREEMKILDIFNSKLFLGVLSIKIISSFIFASDSFMGILEFVRYFVTFGNPYSYFADTGVAFPYAGGMLYLLSIPMFLLYILSYALGSLHFDLFLLRIPILLADVVIYYYLCNLLKNNVRQVQLFYWLSPIVFYINYFVGGIDAIAVALLVASIYYIIENKYILSAFLLGLSISTKTGMVLIAPLIFVYLLKQRFRYVDIAKYFGLSLLLYFVFVLPFIFSPGFKDVAIFSSQQEGLFSLGVSVSSSFQFLLLPAVYIVLVLYLFSFKRINREMLLMLVALVFTVLVTLVPPLPNWYYWIIPFLVYFFIRERTGYAVSYWAFNLFYFGYFVFWKDSDIFNSMKYATDLENLVSPYYVIVNFGFNADLLVNVLYTMLVASLLLCIYWIYKYGVRSNFYYKDRDNPIFIGVGGDSGVGKTTLSNLLVDLFGVNFTTVVSGDDTHKWERGDKNWEKYTHLNPASNRLYMNVGHLNDLKTDKTVRRRIYDHNTGKFTDFKNVQPNKFLIFEGLHSFYLGAIRNMCDVKIFLDTDDDLRKHWKILRDVKERGYTKQGVLEVFSKREEDSRKHVQPQKEFADLIVKFYPKHKIKNLGQEKEVDVILKIITKNSLDVETLLNAMSEIKGLNIRFSIENDLRRQSVVFYGDAKASEIALTADSAVTNYGDFMLNSKIKWSDGYNGVLQLFVLYYISYKLRMVV